MVTKFIVAAALAFTFANPTPIVGDTVSTPVIQVAVSAPSMSTVGAIG